MDRKSSIFIVSFFSYIQVTSHRKVGGKVGKDQLKQNFKPLSLTAGAVSWNSQHYRQCTEAKCYYLFSWIGRGDSGYKLLNCTQATSRKKCRKEGVKAGKNDFDH